jgi:hypothetical protein
MSAEDALFRVMAPVASTLVETRQNAGEAIDSTAIVEATLQVFASSIVLGAYAASLRQRLLAHLANHRPDK